MEITEQIQVYADDIFVNQEGTTNNVTLKGIDISQVIAEFSPQEVLEALTANDHFGAIADYVAKRLEEDNE